MGLNILQSEGLGQDGQEPADSEAITIGQQQEDRLPGSPRTKRCRVAVVCPNAVQCGRNPWGLALEKASRRIGDLHSQMGIKAKIRTPKSLEPWLLRLDSKSIRRHELSASRTRHHSGDGDGFGSIVFSRSDALKSRVRRSPVSYAALRRRVLPTAFDRSQRNNYIFS
jgi:hypothetical protein